MAWRAFAVALYTELASGLPLRAAYEKARGRVLAAHDTVPEAYYGHRDFGTTSESASPDPTDDHGFPWEFRPGTELVERWSLPDAAGNPEFGLPRLPERDSARAVGRISVIGGDEATIDSSSNRPKQLSPRCLEDCGNGRDSR